MTSKNAKKSPMSIAAGFLKLNEDQAKQKIEKLSEPNKQRLRDLIKWVMDYEKHEDL